MFENMKIESMLSILPKHVALFIAHLYSKTLQHTTIRTYISAISFIHKIQGLEDPTVSFLVSKALQGITKMNRHTKTPLLPITKVEMGLILLEIPFATNNIYDQKMYRALFLLTFHACLRAGEVVHSNKKCHTLQLNQIKPEHTSHGLTYSISFETYKHSSGRLPCIQITPTGDKDCPVKILRKFLAIRGEKCGPLFIKENGKPLTRIDFSKFLKDCVELAGLESDNYNTHSFRIGRATQLAQDNASDATIRSTGRWRSSAYQKYIRPTTFHLPN